MMIAVALWQDSLPSAQTGSIATRDVAKHGGAERAWPLSSKQAGSWAVPPITLRPSPRSRIGIAFRDLDWQQ